MKNLKKVIVTVAVIDKDTMEYRQAQGEFNTQDLRHITTDIALARECKGVVENLALALKDQVVMVEK